MRSSSGPAVASAFQRLLAGVLFIAFSSLYSQLGPLLGSRGLLPIAEGVAVGDGASFLQFPTLFRWGATDAQLEAAALSGMLLAVVAFLGLLPRLCLALSALLYLGFVTAGRDFFHFQWDNLLLESAALALFLPRDRKAPLVHFLFRGLLFKLYFESGVAKWTSPIRDWQDGSAMAFYYETAPLPTPLAWYAHQLPAAWHLLESWATLAFELVAPLFIFGPRRARLAVAAIFTAFQGVNTLTANYGFFTLLATALHVFLLDDGDLERLARPLRERLGWTTRVIPITDRTGAGGRAGKALTVGFAALWLTLSALGGVETFARLGPLAPFAQRLAAPFAPFRLANSYHLFAQITRERIEPELQTSDGATWTAHDLRYKAGEVTRAPRFVAPHQPRLDFQLWFYGLSAGRPAPQYVEALVERVCHDPSAVQPFFEGPLPPAPRAVRLVFWQYRFTTRAERAASGAVWKREELGRSAEVPCL